MRLKNSKKLGKISSQNLKKRNSKTKSLESISIKRMQMN